MTTDDQRPERLRIALVAHLAYGALAGGSSRGHIGGVERQTTMMARWLAARGHDVSMLVWDEGQDDATIDGVRVVRVCREDAGLPIVRFVHPRWTSLWRGLARADADVYYHNCGEYVTGQVALWCRLHRRAFVYSSASDADCDGALPLMPELRVRALYRLGVRWADRVIVQTRRQQEMLERGFGRTAAVIPMPCAAPSDPQPAIGASGPVLWIGRICEVKRPDRLLDVAARCPELRFVIAGPNDDTPEYVRRIAERAASIPNVQMLGAATPDQIDRLLREASCLCCTSDREGFPNTFLEAWSRGRPVVSTWDPDDLIAAHGLGEVARDAAGLASALRRLCGSEDERRRIAVSARRYFEQNHAADQILPRFESVFREIAAARRTTKRGGAVVARVAG